MNSLAASFLLRHNFPLSVDIASVATAIRQDMNSGLCGQKSGQDMIRTYTNPPKKSICGKSVIVIDAGGTNFRSCLVTFGPDGVPSISNMEKTRMPGVEKELSKVEFFEQFAKNLEHLKDAASDIGFCFSYPMTITEDGDGVLLGFSKEVKAPEVVGCTIGKELAKALAAHGWKNQMHISLLNDTVAALLAGAACVKEGERYSSYIGFILGTGMNAAYIQGESPLYPGLKEQVIVCESGKFANLIKSDFDIALDSKSVKPGTSLLEKQCSGAYLGPLGREVIHAAAEENLFSQAVNSELMALDSLTLIELDSFLHAPFATGNVLGKIMAAGASAEDYDLLYQLLDAVVERSARLAAAILCACVEQSGKGKSAVEPVCILCDGTTYFKTWQVQNRVTGLLDKLLRQDKGLYYNLVSCDNDITLGTAIGGLIQA